MRKQGDRLKVTAQLIRTDDGYHVWSASFERQLSDVFAVQAELAGSLVAATRVKLTGAVEASAWRSSPAANDSGPSICTFQGIHLLSSFKPGYLDQAERRLQDSIAADPGLRAVLRRSGRRSYDTGQYLRQPAGPRTGFQSQRRPP